jgi:hypothetical protein
MKHKGIVSTVVREIIEQFKLYMESDETDCLMIDLPDETEFFDCNCYGLKNSFFIELVLNKWDEPSYKIDADAPAIIDEDNILIGITANPNTYKTQLSEIYFNLIYTFRHEFEHYLQVISDYNRVNKDCYTISKYSGDSLKTLLKPQEIEPQVLGYHLQSKKENNPFIEVVNIHLNKLINNNQITFKSDKSKEILISTLLTHAQTLKLKINE